MGFSPDTLDHLKIVVPIVTAGATLARVVPGAIIATRARRPLRNASNRNIRVTSLTAPAPWGHVPAPAIWGEVEVRQQYRKKERRNLWFFLFVFAAAATFYWMILLFDVKGWYGRDGSGWLAGPSALLFSCLAASQGVYLRRIRGKRGDGLSLYECRGQVTVRGDLDEVAQYCLGVLINIGCRLVDCKTTLPSAVDITAATGFFPPKRVDPGPLSLISFRGERVSVSICVREDKVCDVSVVSDNYDPGVDEGRRANRRNVQRFVEAWAFFPDHLIVEAVPR